VAIVVAGLLGYVAAAGVPSAGSSSPVLPQAAGAPAWFSFRGTVTRVVDGDTIHVRIARTTEKVRLIGIDAPERGACYAAEASASLRQIALNRTVRLSGDRTQTRRDTYKRLLAYVTLPRGEDAGLNLLTAGAAVVYETRRPFARYDRYVAAEAEAADERRGGHRSCAGPAPPPTTATTVTTATTTTTATVAPVATPLPAPPPSGPAPQPPPAGNCALSYPDVCIPPPPPDLDCGQIPHKRFRVIHNVLSPDPHRFDGDRDGIGCES
jgi:micrococcal nuclease